MTSLTRDQEALLCGRAQETGYIVVNCRQRRLTVVTSAPGMGVTSLLEAGVAPALRREGFIVVVFRDWQGQSFALHLRESIEASVREQAQPYASARGDSLAVILRQVRESSGKSVAVLFDQFEDYLRCHTKTLLAEDFDTELSHALTQRDAAFVVGMQAHALPAFERLKQNIPNLLGNHIQLQALTREAAMEAIEREARAHDLEVAPAAIEALVSAPIALRSTDRVHPFFLKVATAQLLDGAKRIKAPVVDMPMIEARGGVDRVVLESLDAGIADLNPTHLDLLFRWCNILISPDKRRIAVTEKGLTEYAGKLNRFVATLLPIMTGTHLMRPVEMPEAIRWEIAREGLTPILNDWWERREAALQARRRANFRVRSISIAVTSIVVMYLIYIIVSWKQGI
jgi:hypothetical protein